MSKRVWCMFSLLLLCHSMNVLAQDKPLWVTHLERALRQEEARWKIEGTNVKREVNLFTETITLRSGRHRATVSLTVWDTVKNARDVFTGESAALSNILRARVLKTKLGDVGEESYMWVGRSGRGTKIIHLRRGKVYVRVVAPSAEAAERFARRVDEHIPAI